VGDLSITIASHSATGYHGFFSFRPLALRLPLSRHLPLLMGMAFLPKGAS
jgi:hypothetical protein